MALTTAEQIEITKMLGLVAAGLWAAWTFHKLQKVRTAVLDNEAKLSEIQKKRIEQEQLRTQLLRLQPQLAIQLEVAELDSSGKRGNRLLSISVVLKNEGEQNLSVQFENDALTVGKIGFDKNGEHAIKVDRFGPSYFLPDSDEPQFFTERIFRVGQQRRMVLAVLPITEQGAYIIQFHAVYQSIPFDGEKKSPDEAAPGDAINAVEQTVYFATNKPLKAESFP